MNFSSRVFLAIAVLILSNSELHSQNLDLGFIHSSGELIGVAGSDIGRTEGISSLDINPAGLATTSQICISVSQSVRYYSYLLHRRNIGVAAINFDWDKIRFNFDNILIAIPSKKRVVFGMGLIRKTNAHLYNYRRAITWSSLFNHETTGSIYALTLSSSLKLTQKISLGFTFYRYFGTITSTVNGENHGFDAGKWAALDNSFSGWNFRMGAVFRLRKFSTGLIFESPGNLNVSVRKDISTDRMYEYLFPNYDQTKWEIPFVVGFGFAYTGLKNSVFTFDFETRQYEKSNFQLNLFEFGGQPNWKDVNIFRMGAEFQFTKLPIRLGYAYIPQLYASNNAIGLDNEILEYEDTSQNVKHLFAIGTTVKFSKVSFNFGFEHTFVKWHRNLDTRMFIEDDYTEKTFFFSSEAIYYFR